MGNVPIAWDYFLFSLSYLTVGEVACVIIEFNFLVRHAIRMCIIQTEIRRYFHFVRFDCIDCVASVAII